MNSQNDRPVTPRVRLDYIDALRGIAALMVLVCHSIQIDTALQLPAHTVAFFESFKYGVQLFFVISAFTICYSLYSSDAGTYNFFIRRFFRIAPLYFVALAFYAIVAQAPLSGIVLNATFLHGLSPAYINSVVPGGWSIGVEVLFYCAVPFLFQAITNLRAAIYFFLAAIISSFLLFYTYRKLLPSTGAAESFIYFWLPNQLPVFAIGFIIYFLTFHTTAGVKGLFYPLTGLTVLIMVAILTDYPFFQKHVLFGAAAGLLVFLLKFQRLPLLVNRVTLLLGKISYSLYLSNYAAIYLLQKTGLYSFFRGHAGKYMYGNIVLNMILLISVTTLLAYGLYYRVELPFQKLGKNFLKKREPFTQPATILDGGGVRAVFRSQEANK